VPILHSQYRAGRNLPNGKIVQLPIQVGLRTHGPLVQVTIWLADPVASKLAEEGKPVPAPVVGNALLDTGAVSTCIDEEAAQKLQLPVVNVVNMASASHPSTKANVYPVKFQIAGLPFDFTALAIGAPLAVQGLIALIGRDVLQHCTLIYSGGLSQISLCI
jgi:predicted aspartyl protease